MQKILSSTSNAACADVMLAVNVLGHFLNNVKRALATVGKSLQNESRFNI